MAGYIRTSAPGSLPVTLEEVKLHLKYEETEDDDLITSLIQTAVEYIEKTRWQPIIQQTWKLYLDYQEFTSLLHISKCPVSSITHVKYYDSSNTIQTLSDSTYFIDIVSSPARIQFNSIPTIYNRINAVEIQFVCGYADAASVPDDIKHAIKLLVGHWYEHREDVVVGTTSNLIERSVDALLSTFTNNLTRIPIR